jgi:probable O-glycosylation ligase (exosortase A-associated)
MEKGLLFTYILTYGGAIAALANPYAGLLVYICFAIIRPESMWHWSVPQGNYSRIVAVALLIGWALRGFGSWDFGRGRALVVCLIGFMGWGIASGMQADQPKLMLHWAECMAKVVLPFLVGVTMIDSVAKLKSLVWCIVLSQGYVALELNLDYFSGFNQAHAEGFAGMDNNCVAIAMNTCIGLAFFLGLHSSAWWRKGLAFAAAALMAHAVMMSFSRGGITGLIVVVVVTMLIVPKQPKHYVIFALGVILLLQMAGSEVRERFMTSFAAEEQRDFSAQSRLTLWEQCWQVMLENPLFGAGPGHWMVMSTSRFGWQVGKMAHNLWMEIGAEMGFPGLAFLGLFYGLCIFRLWPYTRDKIPVPDPWCTYLARMVIVALVGFCVSSTFVSLWGLETPYYLVMVGVGVLKLSTQFATEASVFTDGELLVAEA